MKITDKKLRIKLKVLICIVCALIFAGAVALFVIHETDGFPGHTHTSVSYAQSQTTQSGIMLNNADN